MTYRVCGKVKSRVFDKSQIWKHNGLLGKCKQAELAMQAIYDAETTTDECRALAAHIEGELTHLFRILHTRRDSK